MLYVLLVVLSVQSLEAQGIEKIKLKRTYHRDYLLRHIYRHQQFHRNHKCDKGDIIDRSLLLSRR